MSGSFPVSLHKYGSMLDRNRVALGTSATYTHTDQSMKTVLFRRFLGEKSRENLFRVVTAVRMGVFCFENDPCFLELTRPTRKVFCGSVQFAYTFLRVLVSSSLVFVCHLLSGKSC